MSPLDSLVAKCGWGGKLVRAICRERGWRYYALPDGSITADPSAPAVQVGVALRSDTLLVTGPAGVVL